MHTNWQVCSLVVQAKSERISDISTQLNAFPGCEVAVSDAPSGQLIVVVEAEDSETLIQTIELARRARVHLQAETLRLANHVPHAEEF